MVATLTTYDGISSSTPVSVPGGESDTPLIDLRDLTGRPGSVRGVTAHASDWLSCLERRRSGSYLPI